LTHVSRGSLSYRVDSLGPVLIGLDLDGVVCDLGPGVATRIADRFDVASHPDTWRTYDLRLLRLGVPQAPFVAFLDDLFADPHLYDTAPVVEGAAWGVARLREVGWRVVGITARPLHLAAVTMDWLARHRLPVEAIHHTPVGGKAQVADRLGVAVTVEDNPEEAERLGHVCESWLLDRPYNREYPLMRARRLRSWDDAVGRLCQLRLFA
jgi:uncharacterized HAD superfamily protein